MQSTRRELLRSAGLLGGALLFSRGLAACLLDSSRTDGDHEASEAALVQCHPPIISANHGHALVVPPDDVAAGVTRTYSIKGASGHDHLVTLTAADFAELAAGRSVTVGSTRDAGHTHSVTVTCAVTGSNGDGAQDDAGADASPAACTEGARAGRISANHGHALVVSAADVAAGTTRSYSIQGTSSHPHTVTITAADFAELRAGRTVTVVSTNDFGHAHTVEVSCA